MDTRLVTNQITQNPSCSEFQLCVPLETKSNIVVDTLQRNAICGCEKELVGEIILLFWLSC